MAPFGDIRMTVLNRRITAVFLALFETLHMSTVDNSYIDTDNQ